ncbi:hypothetical protein SASPL_114407 [Salvia splendens]|uniref:Uncharacterized protein n=1 Tax=Salvia splendens TaxID=180675 RepID=A0A8X8Y191_SALSN|nr:hypothetical protein SASPL_114407 [Salvia splendens]
MSSSFSFSVPLQVFKALATSTKASSTMPPPPSQSKGSTPLPAKALVSFSPRSTCSPDFATSTWSPTSATATMTLIEKSFMVQISTACLEAFVGIAGRCLDLQPQQRPDMGDVVKGLELAMILQQDKHQVEEDVTA